MVVKHVKKLPGIQERHLRKVVKMIL